MWWNIAFFCHRKIGQNAVIRIIAISICTFSNINGPL
jgi:hypothetical protein